MSTFHFLALMSNIPGILHLFLTRTPPCLIALCSNELGQWIKDFMRQDGVNPDDMKRPQRVFSLPGGYRKLVNKPHVLKALLRVTSLYSISS